MEQIPTSCFIHIYLIFFNFKLSIKNILSMFRANSETRKEFLKDDVVVNYLGYWTDNGAYYSGRGPITTSIATKLFNQFRINNIPINYLQLDPFWYSGGTNGNNIYWIPRKDLFPNGLSDLYKQIGNIRTTILASICQCIIYNLLFIQKLICKVTHKSSSVF